MISNKFNNYRYLDQKEKQYIRTNGYNTILTNMIGSMFDFTEFTITEKYALMDILVNLGMAYVEKQEKGFLILPAAYAGLPAHGQLFPNKIIAIGTYENSTINIHDNINNLKGDIFYCFPDRTAIMEIPRFAYQFAEVDTSLVNNIQFSRIAPIVSTPYENVRKSYKKAVENMMDGELINSITAVQNVLNNENKSIEKIDISDGDYSEKIQYLSMYHKQLIEQFCTLFGIPYNFTSKQANITNDELNNNEVLASIYPHMMLNLLNECIENFNKKCGTNITIKFNKSWAHLNKIDNDITEQTENGKSENEKTEDAGNENISNT